MPIRSIPRLAAAVLAAGACTHAGAALAPDELFRQLSPSVWQVATFDAARKPVATGSAVVIAPDTLVTNCHVLKGAASFVVRQRGTLHPAKLQHADAERDLCQVTAAGLGAPVIAIAPEPAQVGQRIYTIGSPVGLEATLSDGLVSGLRNDSAGALAYIQISAPISPGSSGGGLFDADGRLLGITTSGIVGVAQNLNFARPASMIPDIPQRAAAALQKWREAAATTPAPKPLPPAAAWEPPPRSTPPVASALPPLTRTTPARPPQAAWLASGFAVIDDVDAVPYLNDRGRDGYREWLGKGTPRAFAIAPNGHWASSWGLKPRDPEAPVDPAERAMWTCERLAHTQCKLYAVNRSVVWVRESPAADAAAPARR